MSKRTAYSTDKYGITWIPTAAIRTDAGTQHRDQLDQKAVAEYAQQMHDKQWNWRRSPIKITREGDIYWMVGGFHRLEAAEKANLPLVGCIVSPGTRRDAILASFSENRNHGVRLDNVSKRNKVLTLLEDEEWRRWSSHEIAKRCGVSHSFVDRLRVTGYKSSDEGNESSNDANRTFINKHGSVSQMNTEPISESNAKRAADSTPPTPPTAPSAAPHSIADLVDSKFYPVLNFKHTIFDDPFDNHHACQSHVAYAGCKAITGSTIKRNVDFRKYEIAPSKRVAAAGPTEKTPDEALREILGEDEPAAQSDVQTTPATEPPAQAATAETPPMIAKLAQDDKWYMVDAQRNKIFNKPFDTEAQARAALAISPFYSVLSSETINARPNYEHWEFIQPVAAPNQTVAPRPNSSNGSSLHEVYSNTGDFKDTPVSPHEALAVEASKAALAAVNGNGSNGNLSHPMWLNTLDYRLLVETHIVDIDEDTLKRIAKPLKEHVVDCLRLATGSINGKAYGASSGAYFTAVVTHAKAAKTTSS